MTDPTIADVTQVAEPVAELAWGDLETEDIPNVPILRTGTHVDRHGKVVKVTAEHVKEIAASMAGLLARGYKSLIQLTHDKTPLTDALPTMGNVEGFHVEVDKTDGAHVLLGDFRKVPKLLAQLMRVGGYQSVSGKFVRPYKLGEHVAPWAVPHVAVLGVQHPAVAGLKSLQDVANLYRPDRGLAMAEADGCVMEFEDAGVVPDAPVAPDHEEEVEMGMDELLKAKGLKDEAELDAKLAQAAKLDASEAARAKIEAELAARDEAALTAATDTFIAGNAIKLGKHADAARLVFTACSRSAESVEFTAGDGAKTVLRPVDALTQIVAAMPDVVPTKEEGAAEFTKPGDGGGNEGFDAECERPNEDGVLNVELAKMQEELAKKIMAEDGCDLATAYEVALVRLSKNSK
jgi:hypothetical protein